MTRLWPVVLVCLLLCDRPLHAVEERIRGILEKTANPNACAQITDALNDVYFIIKTVENEKACGPLIGQRVVLTGTVEERAEDRQLYLTLKQAERYQPKQPGQPEEAPTTTPLPPPTPPASPVPLPDETKKTE